MPKRKANTIPGNVDQVNYGYDRGRGGGKLPNPAANRAKRQAAASNLTFVKGNRSADDLDPVSKQILEVAITGHVDLLPGAVRTGLPLVLPAGRPGARPVCGRLGPRHRRV